MFCSISSKNSNPKWLDRLRSSKGFSDAATDSGADHDHIVLNQNKPTNISSQQTDPEAQFSSIPSPTDSPAPFLGDVLAELFAFGPDPPNIPSKKHPRKIPNPKCCKVENFNNFDSNLRVLQRSDDCNDRREEGKEVFVSKKRVLCEEEEKMDLSLSGFSRTEVTVIDTSCKGWKFDKVLFRKKSVWKVRDRKSKGSISESNKKKMKMMNKKSKLSAEEEEGEIEVCKKKRKMVFGQCSSSKEGKRGEFSMRVNDELHRKLSLEEEDVGVCKKKKKMVFGQCSSSKEAKRGDLSMRINDEVVRKGKLICYT